MNWDRIEGSWKEVMGKARQRWGELNEDDWSVIGGKREELIGRIQQRYGKNREEAEKEVDEWGRGLH